MLYGRLETGLAEDSRSRIRIGTFGVSLDRYERELPDSIGEVTFAVTARIPNNHRPPRPSTT